MVTIPRINTILGDKKSETSLPSYAVEVKIDKIIDPYTILITDVRNFSETIDKISKKLRGIMKRMNKCKKNNEDEQSKLAPGSLVLVCKETPDGIDLPAWCSRALIMGYNEENSKYTAYLPDYGEIFELCRRAFTSIPPDSFSDTYLTETVGLYNIFPAKKCKSNKSKISGLIIQTQWTPESIDLVKNLLAVAEKCYFNAQTLTKNQKYGELYIIIDEQVIPLSKALISAHYAVACNKNLLKPQNSIDFSTSSDLNTTITDKSIDEIFNDEPDCRKSKKAQRICCDDIFVSSEKECRPLENISEAKFPEAVHAALEDLSVSHMWKLQSYMWPAISKGLDILAIGPAKHGKTFGFIAPIINIIVKTKKYQVEDYPMVLILCESSAEVMKTVSIFRVLLKNYSKGIRVVAAYNGCTNRSITAQVYSGCHIFISTPAFLLRYLNDDYHKDALKFNYIAHLIIDNLDMLINKHLEASIEFLGKYTPFSKLQQNCMNLMSLQIIATSRTWSVDVGKFIQTFNNPYVCIKSFADTTIFCGIKLRTRLVHKDQKKVKVSKILEESYKMAKTMIVCAHNDEAEELNEFLKKKFDTLFVHTKMILVEIIAIKELWKAGVSGTYKLLICTDEVLSNLDVSDVDWLIHYSVAASSKSAFLFRFSTLMMNLKKKSSNTEVTIFIDDSNDVQLRGVLDLVVRSGYKFSTHQLDAFEKIYVNIERQKKGVAICDNIKAFGNCQLIDSCTYRHCMLADADAPITNVSVGDKVQFIIAHVHSPIHFSVRIIEFIDNEGQKHSTSEKDHVNIISKVLYYYANKENRRRSKDIEVGGIYGFDKSFDQYVRVQVINVTKYNDTNGPKVVDLRSIDSGRMYSNVRVSKLVEMPKELTEAPAHIVEVFLANIQPFDQETEWSRRATECTEKWLRTEIRSNNFLQAKVCLHLGNTLWVNPLEIRMKIRQRGEVVNSSLMNHLIKEKHGIVNENHIEDLKKLCSNAGMGL